MKDNFITCEEIFNADYLNYIINNFDSFKNYFDNDKLVILKKYLHKSRHGKIRVDYKQNNGKGRFCSIGSLSLQNIPRKIRQTISKDYYIDVDMVNAHPIILQWLCIQNNFNCKELTYYINNREDVLKRITFNGEYIRDRAKQVILSLTNGGNKDYTEADENIFLTNYKNEMIDLHRLFSEMDVTGFNTVRDKRIKDNKNFNHEASYMNTLLCDMENTLLQEMYNYFESPKNVVLCFDGIMLRNNKTYDILGCIEYISTKYSMPLFNLLIKPMNEYIDMSSYCDIYDKIQKYNYFSLEYYSDFRNLVKEEEIYEEWIEEWVNNSLVLIENNGKQYFLTKNKKTILYSDKTKEIEDKWSPVKTEDIEKSLKVKVHTKNVYYNYTFAQKYNNMKKSEQAKLLTSMGQDELSSLINYYSFTTLGLSSFKLGKGYLSYIMEYRKINSFNSINFFPFLKNDNESFYIEDVFNLFTNFPLENKEQVSNSEREDTNIVIDFENSLLYNHLKQDFFNYDEGELNHFLDHIADIIQDPGRIKGTSHLFYSPQGCGKGLLFKFMNKLLGSSNVVSIINTDAYFDKTFNIDVGNKLLKVFEEVSEKGSAFKNHNRLKGEQTSETERIEPKGVDPFHTSHCARFWYFTNNENSLYIENDDRRHTLHRIRSTHQNNYEYFKPIWDEISNTEFLKNAFKYFATRKYDEKNVFNSYTTDYKKEQKESNLPNGIKFILYFIQQRFDKIENKDTKVPSEIVKEKYKSYCFDLGIKYHFNTLNTQLKKIGIAEPRQLWYNSKDGISRKKFCYIINTFKLEQEMKRYLQDDNYVIMDEEVICDEESIDSGYIQ